MGHNTLLSQIHAGRTDMRGDECVKRPRDYGRRSEVAVGRSHTESRCNILPRRKAVCIGNRYAKLLKSRNLYLSWWRTLMGNFLQRGSEGRGAQLDNCQLREECRRRLPVVAATNEKGEVSPSPVFLLLAQLTFLCQTWSFYKSVFQDQLAVFIFFV